MDMIFPTEPRVARIVMTVCWGLGVRPVKGALPYGAVCGTVALALLAYRAQKRLWKSEMQAKAASAAGG
jgi:hypothetical protein